MILGIIIGILICNIVCSIILCLTSNSDIVMVFGCGVVGGLIVLFDTIFKKIKIIIRNMCYCSALIDPEGKPCYCAPWLLSQQEGLIFDSGYNWNYNLKEKYKATDLLCHNGYSQNLRYTPIKIAKAEGSYKINKKDLKKLIDKWTKV